MRGYSSDANGSAIRVSKFRGSSTSPRVPNSGDSLGRFEFAGYASVTADGLAGAYWEAITTEMWGATGIGTKVLLKVTPSGTTTPLTALTVDQDRTITAAAGLLGYPTLLPQCKTCMRVGHRIMSNQGVNHTPFRLGVFQELQARRHVEE